MRPLTPEELRFLAARCGGVALLLFAAIFISQGGLEKSLGSLSVIDQSQTAATWLGTQQGVPGYNVNSPWNQVGSGSNGSPRPQGCKTGPWGKGELDQTPFTSAPGCNNWATGNNSAAIMAVFSAHPAGSTAGKTAYTLQTINPAGEELGPYVGPAEYDGGEGGGYYCPNTYAPAEGYTYVALGSGANCYSARQAAESHSYSPGSTGSNPTVASGGALVLEWACQDYEEFRAVYCSWYWTPFGPCGGYDNYGGTKNQFDSASSNFGGSGLLNSTTVYPTSNTTYSLTCSGPVGSATMSIPVTISVPIPAAPNVTASYCIGGTCTGVWGSVSGATLYPVRLTPKPSGGCSAIGSGWSTFSDNATCVHDTNSGTNMTFNNLSTGTAYTWWVHAYNAGGWSSPSSHNFTPLPPPNITASSCSNSTTCSGTWSSVAYNTNLYPIRLTPKPTAGCPAIGANWVLYSDNATCINDNTTGTSMTFSNLNPGTAYTWWVHAANTNALGTWTYSNQATGAFTTQGAAVCPANCPGTYPSCNAQSGYTYNSGSNTCTQNNQNNSSAPNCMVSGNSSLSPSPTSISSGNNTTFSWSNVGGAATGATLVCHQNQVSGVNCVDSQTVTPATLTSYSSGNITNSTGSTVAVPFTITLTNSSGSSSCNANVNVSGGGTPPPANTISISAAGSPGEPSTTGTYTVTRGGSNSSPLGVYIDITGSATNNTDYTLAGGYIDYPSSARVTFMPGQSTIIVTLTPVDDTTAEGNETAVLTLNSPNGYTISGNAAATLTITDNDAADTCATDHPSAYTPITVIGTASGSIWGGNGTANGSYTWDSAVGKAAVHAGLVSIGQTMDITRTSMGLSSSYAASTQHGVTSLSYSSSACGVKLTAGCLHNATCSGDNTKTVDSCSGATLTNCSAGQTCPTGGSACINAPSAELSLSVTPSRVRRRGTITVVWSGGVSGTACTLSSTAAGVLSSSLNGTLSQTISKRTTFTLTCDSGSPLQKSVSILPSFLEI
ncbi:hypothetical protein EXS62_00945 [Candidatus Kaiserbacteria bacterium]|nr:hypothetical protein [Candidatus Kaiserbacteria bacterium]